MHEWPISSLVNIHKEHLGLRNYEITTQFVENMYKKLVYYKLHNYTLNKT